MLREKWLAMRSKLAFFLMRHSITVRLEHTADGGVQQNTESSAAISKYCHQISAHNILCPEARPTESQVHVSCCTPQLLDQKTFPRIFRKNKNKLNWSGCHSALTHRHLIYTISHTAGTVWNLYNVFWIRRSKVRKQSTYTTLLLKIVPQLCQQFLSG